MPFLMLISLGAMVLWCAFMTVHSFIDSSYTFALVYFLCLLINAWSFTTVWRNWL